MAGGNGTGAKGLGTTNTAASTSESTRAKTYGATAGARSRVYSQNCTIPVTANSSAVPSTHVWARPRSGFVSATQATITRTATERAPAASMSPRRS